MLFTTYSPQPREALVCYAVQKVHWMQEKEAGTRRRKYPEAGALVQAPRQGPLS